MKTGRFRGVCNDGYVFMDSWHVYKDVVLNGMKDCAGHGGFTAAPPRDVSGTFEKVGSSKMNLQERKVNDSAPEIMKIKKKGDVK